MLDWIDRQLVALLAWARRTPYLGVCVRAAERSVKQHDKDMAASIAYFTFLSFFPLVLGLISLGGYVLKSEDMQVQLNQLILQILPVDAEYLTRITDSVVRIRGATGITSVITLIWSASKMMGALTRTINRALDQKRTYAIYLSKLRNFALTLLIAVLLLLALAISPLLEVLAELQLEALGDRANAIIHKIGGRTSSLLTTILMVGTVYALVPHQRLTFSAILPGLLAASILIEIGKATFVWSVGTASSYSAVYGSMSSIIVVLIWLYFSARAVIYGAEVIRENLEDKST